MERAGRGQPEDPQAQDQADLPSPPQTRAGSQDRSQSRHHQRNRAQTHEHVRKH